MVDTAALQRYSLFGALSTEDIERVKPFLALAEYPASAAIIEEGRPNDSIYFILEGRVEVLKKGLRLLEIGEGETFGEVELLDVMPSVATIRALAPTRVAIISNRAVREIFHADARIFAIIMMNLARDLSRRLRRMDEQAAGGRS
jgi:CRP-like cAMP-binding protein